MDLRHGFHILALIMSGIPVAASAQRARMEREGAPQEAKGDRKPAAASTAARAATSATATSKPAAPTVVRVASTSSARAASAQAAPGAAGALATARVSSSRPTHAADLPRSLDVGYSRVNPRDPLGSSALATGILDDVEKKYETQSNVASELGVIRDSILTQETSLSSAISAMAGVLRGEIAQLRTETAAFREEFDELRASTNAYMSKAMTWDSIVDKPKVFAPADHSHTFNYDSLYGVMGGCSSSQYYYDYTAKEEDHRNCWCWKYKLDGPARSGRVFSFEYDNAPFCRTYCSGNCATDATWRAKAIWP